MKAVLYVGDNDHVTDEQMDKLKAQGQVEIASLGQADYFKEWYQLPCLRTETGHSFSGQDGINCFLDKHNK